MRTIKFRAKLKGRWNTHKAGEHIYFDLKMMDDKLSRLPIDWETVAQFTGLHDKNGKEIYEGDVVKSLANNDSDIWAIDMSNLYWYTSPKGHAFDNSWILFEVIGNIYENPDLITSSPGKP